MPIQRAHNRPNRRRILILAAFAESIIPFRGQLIKRMLSAGHDVHVAAPELDPAFGVGLQLSGFGVSVHDVKLKRAGKNPISDGFYFVSLILLMRRVRPDVVLAYTIKPVIYGMLASSFMKVSTKIALITGLGYSFGGERRSSLASVARFLYGVAVRRADKVMFQNPDDKALFAERGMLSPRAEVQVLNGSGVDLKFFQPRQIPESPVSFLMIGRLLGDKGVREYVAAARKVRDAFPLARFRLAGWIDANPDAISKEELTEWCSSGAIEFLGKIEDVRPAIAASSVFVLPSYREGTPRTVLEAMAMGRPIITTDVPGCRETVVDGYNGFLVAARSIEELERAMLRFMMTPEIAIDMGQRSRRIAQEKYDVHRVNDAMLAAIGASGQPVKGELK